MHVLFLHNTAQLMPNAVSDLQSGTTDIVLLLLLLLSSHKKPPGLWPLPPYFSLFFQIRAIILNPLLPAVVVSHDIWISEWRAFCVKVCTNAELHCQTSYREHQTHLSVVKGKKPIVQKKSPMKTFSLNPTSPVAGDGLRRALFGRSASENHDHHEL